ncbi:hypothetical protein NMG60_11012078 [Bertholletia excelsa]
MLRKVIFVAVLLILLVRGESKASMFRTFMRFVDGGSHRRKTEMSPSPSPLPIISNSFGNDQAPGASPKEKLIRFTDERCVKSSSNWCEFLKNVTACMPYAGNGAQGTFLIIQNDEENLVRVNASILPSKIAFDDIKLPKHRAIKINISAYLGGIQSVVIEAGNESCKTDSHPYEIPTYATIVKPMHGVSFLAVTILIIGGAWAYFKLRKGERHLDGVPYQELEMGNPKSLAAANVETADGWDQKWGDDWDEERAVKSPSGKHVRRQANGLPSRSSSNDEWENNWDD